jgi:hypothetical protein
MRDLGIYIKGFEKMFDRFEELKKGIIASIHPLGDLMHLRVRRIAHTVTQEGHIRQVEWRGQLVLRSQVGITVEWISEADRSHEPRDITRWTESPSAALADSVHRMDVIFLIDFINLSLPVQSSSFRARS